MELLWSEEQIYNKKRKERPLQETLKRWTSRVQEEVTRNRMSHTLISDFSASSTVRTMFPWSKPPGVHVHGTALYQPTAD